MSGSEVDETDKAIRHVQGRRVADFYEFVVSHLSPRPARVLEVGCGRGDLALALAKAGHTVTAIDPVAPDGPIFRQVRLEDFDGPGPYDAVVASVSLHHVESLASAFDRVAALLRPGGMLIVEEFAKERLAGPTARWYYHQRRAVAALGREDAEASGDFDTWHADWAKEHADIHPLTAMRRELDRRFLEREFVWTPYLYSYGLDDALEPLERTLIEAGELDATGFRYVGERRREPRS